MNRRFLFQVSVPLLPKPLRVDIRFIVENIKPCCKKFTGFKSSNKRFIVNDDTPAGVDNYSAIWQQVDKFSIEQPCRFRRGHTMQCKKITVGHHFFQRGMVDGSIFKFSTNVITPLLKSILLIFNKLSLYRTKVFMFSSLTKKLLAFPDLCFIFKL